MPPAQAPESQVDASAQLAPAGARARQIESTQTYGDSQRNAQGCPALGYGRHVPSKQTSPAAVSHRGRRKSEDVRQASPSPATSVAWQRPSEQVSPVSQKSIVGSHACSRERADAHRNGAPTQRKFGAHSPYDALPVATSRRPQRLPSGRSAMSDVWRQIPWTHKTAGPTPRHWLSRVQALPVVAAVVQRPHPLPRSQNNSPAHSSSTSHAAPGPACPENADLQTAAGSRGEVAGAPTAGARHCAVWDRQSSSAASSTSARPSSTARARARF